MKLAFVLLLLAGCATVSRPETFVACRAADVVTTAAAVHGGAEELNPLVARLISHGWAPFVLVEAAVAWYVYRAEQRMPTNARTALNVLSCAPAVSNAAALAGR